METQLIRDVDEIRVLKTDGFFGITLPVVLRLPGTLPATAGNWTAPFFTAQRPYELVGIVERHETAGTDGSAVTAMLKKVPSGTAPASGTNMLASSLNLKSAANTNQAGVVSQAITTGIPNRLLRAGDSLSLVTTGTLTSVAGVTASVLLKAV